MGIRSAHERVWLVEQNPIWLPQAYLTRGDLEPARGNLHVCKFLRDLTITQIRTVTAECVIFVLGAVARRTCYIARKEGRKEKEKEGRRRRRKEGRKEGENQKEREKEGRNSYWERGRKGETNNRVLSWVNTRISFLLPFTPALDNKSNTSSDNWSSTKCILWTYWCQFCYNDYHSFNAVKKILVFLLLRTSECKSPRSNLVIIIIIIQHISISI